jgi:hypothetical protein
MTPRNSEAAHPPQESRFATTGEPMKPALNRLPRSAGALQGSGGPYYVHHI